MMMVADMVLISEEIHKRLAEEDERHRLRRIAISRGWLKQSDLAEAFGIAKVGVPYDVATINHALNGRKYPGIARELEEFMLANDGPNLEVQEAVRKGA